MAVVCNPGPGFLLLLLLLLVFVSESFATVKMTFCECMTEDTMTSHIIFPLLHTWPLRQGAGRPVLIEAAINAA